MNISESMLDRALRYSKLGLTVIPVVYKDKYPSIKWKQYQTERPSTNDLIYWFSSGCKNMGIVTGTFSGVVCVDQDSQEAIDYVNQNLPKTSMRTKSGSGKIHSYYRHPGKTIPNSVNIKHIKIDIRGDGGQVVAPGSIHPNGGIYEEIGEWGPISELPIFDPKWFDIDGSFTNNGQNDIETAIIEYIKNSEKSIQGSNGSAALMKIVRKFISEFKLNNNDAMKWLEVWNSMRAEPAWSKSELQHAIDTVNKTHGKHVSNSQNKQNNKKQSNMDSFLTWNYYSDGSPKSVKRTTDNLIKIICNHEKLYGVIGFNELINTAVLLIEPPWYDYFKNAPKFSTGVAWTDDDTIGLVGWIETEYDVSFTPALINMSVDLISKSNTFHPIKTMIHSIIWDGVSRIDSMMVRYYGCDDTKYSKLVGRFFLISMIARVERPGCKVDHCVIFEGEQSTCKSQSIQILARKSEYFIDSEIPIGKTDAYQNIRGAWIIEIPEIDKLFKYDSSDVKSYITSQVDTYRPSYGRRVLKFQRQCIFTGTTNKYIYFKDVTGNRRFWPVRTSKIDLEALEKDADQLLSEALFLYKNGERWWPSREEQEEVFKLEQKKRMISDSWEEIVWEYINTNNRWKVEVSEILKNVIDLKPSDWNHAHENRVAKILIGFGWERKQLRRKDDPEHRRFYAYIRPIINIESKSSNILEPSEEYDID